MNPQLHKWSHKKRFPLNKSRSQPVASLELDTVIQCRPVHLDPSMAQTKGKGSKDHSATESALLDKDNFLEISKNMNTLSDSSYTTDFLPIAPAAKPPQLYNQHGHSSCAPSSAFVLEKDDKQINGTTKTIKTTANAKKTTDVNNGKGGAQRKDGKDRMNSQSQEVFSIKTAQALLKQIDRQKKRSKQLCNAFDENGNTFSVSETFLASTLATVL